MKLHLAIALLAVTACHKKTEDAAKAPPAAPAKTAETPPAPAAAPAAPAAAPVAATGAKGACEEGSYKDPDGVFCIKLPQGFAMPKEDGKSVEDGTTKDSFSNADDSQWDTVSVSWWVKADNQPDFDYLKKHLDETDKDSKLEQQVDYDGGNGHFSIKHDGTMMYSHSVLNAGNKVVECDFSWHDSQKPPSPEVCKSMHAL